MPPTDAPLPASAQGETDARRQAALWLLELQEAEEGPAGLHAEQQARWQRWLAASLEHRAAWARIEAFGVSLGQVPAPLALAALQPGKPRRRALKMMALLFTAGTGTLLATRHGELPVLLAGERSGPGERRQLVLADGSRVDLNGGSALDIAYDAAARRIVLRAGEIHIATAPDAAGRPFFVVTPQGSAEALGTRFSVRSLGDGSNDVAVYEGRVALRPRQLADTPPLVLAAGERASFSELACGPVMAAGVADIAWTQGMLIVEDLPLPHFVAELARQSGRALHCDPALGHLRVSGSYPLASPEAVFDLLRRTLPIRLQVHRQWWGAPRLEILPI